MDIEQKNITNSALTNYSRSDPWPDNDPWHSYTRYKEKEIIEKWLSNYSASWNTVLNAGSGGTEYNIPVKTLIHLDIIEKYIDHFEKYIVGSIEKIPLASKSLDGIICVGSVLNYADAQRAIAEFARLLRNDGFLILEFERSESAEFLGTREYGKDIFPKQYNYNGQEHLLWLYSEKHILSMLQYYGFYVHKKVRIHTLSSLINRLGVPEARASKYARMDSTFHAFSYPLAHNIMLFLTKDVPSESKD